MTIETLIKMIERRGYEVYHYPKMKESPDIEMLSIQNMDMMIRHAFSTLHLTFLHDELFRVEVEAILSKLSEGQHHMACIQCKEPLLQATTKTKHWTEDTNDLKELQRYINQLPWTETYEYRSVKAGPQSEPLTICPSCGIDLEPGTVVEIKDEDL